MIKDISVVLLGAGKSKRFDTNTLKQNVKIHDKRIIDYSVDFFRKHFNFLTFKNNEKNYNFLILSTKSSNCSRLSHKIVIDPFSSWGLNFTLVFKPSFSVNIFSVSSLN